jgi:hypothetical protein
MAATFNFPATLVQLFAMQDYKSSIILNLSDHYIFMLGIEYIYC